MIARLVALVLSLLTLPAMAGGWLAIDGDTVIAPGGERIRVLGVDTPELHPCRCEFECRLGQRAKRRTQKLLDTGPVTVAPFRPDRYGRMLARILIDGRDISLILIEEGLARPYSGERRQTWCQ
jgi:micrococcal nuclease